MIGFNKHNNSYKNIMDPEEESIRQQDYNPNLTTLLISVHTKGDFSKVFRSI